MARRDHSRLGLGIFVMLVVTYAAQIIVYFAVDPEITSDGVTALILSAIILKERMSFLAIVGAVLILGSAMASEFERKPA